MSGIPVASIKDSDSLVILHWKASKELDEADVIVDLVKCERLTI